MKKVLMVIVALVMALTTILGSVTTASAASINDNGHDYFVAFNFWDSTNSIRWAFTFDNFYDNSIYEDYAYVERSGNLIIYKNNITNKIDWGKGIATISSENFSITIKFNPKDVKRETIREGNNLNIYTLISGKSMTLEGTVKADNGYTYNIPSTIVNIANLGECHIYSLPGK